MYCRKYYLVIILICIQYLSFGQSGYQKYDPNCPSCRTSPTDLSSIPTESVSDVAINGDFANTPVNYYTGTPDISLPLYTINYHGFVLPISLNYDASGVKVQQEASWAGLGWDLSGIPSIYRVVRGGDDFRSSGNNATDNPNLYSLGLGPVAATCPDLKNTCKSLFDNSTTVNTFVNYELDLQQDIFYLDLGTQFGSFLIDPSRATNRSVSLLLKEQIKVNLIFETNVLIPSFEVITANGTKYYFGSKPESPGTYPSPRYSPDYSSQYFDYSIQYELVLKWHLRKVIIPTGEEIIFSYNSRTGGTDFYEMEEYVYNSLVELQNGTPSKITTRKVGQFKGIGTISQIDFPEGKILFKESITNRLDFSANAKSLIGLEVYNVNNSLVKKMSFEYDYFNNGTYSTPIPGDLLLPRLKYLRLKLLRVKEVDVISGLTKPSYEFNYNENLTLGIVDNNNLKLPPKNSVSFDHWGYYNAKNLSEIKFKPTKEKVLVNSTYVNFKGLDRDVDTTYSQIGILTKIIYPTGGYTEYTYESNKYNSPLNVATTIGGVRLKQSRTSDGDANNSNDILKNYKYNLTDAQGNLTSNSSGVLMEDVQYTRMPSSSTSGWPLIRSGNNILPSGTHNGGSIVGYSEVTELIGANGEYGKVINKYHALPNFYFENTVGNSPLKDYYIYAYDNLEKMSPTYNSSNAAFANYMYVRNGLLKESIIYEKVGTTFNLTKRVQNKYNNSNANSYSGFSFILSNNIVKNGVYTFELSSICCPAFPCYRDICENIELLVYKTPSLRLKLTESNEYFYDQSDPNIYTIDKTTYEYNNSTHLQLEKVCLNPGEAGSICTEFTYPSDYSCLTLTSSSPNVNAILDMRSSSRNLLDVVIEKIVKKDILGDGNYKVIKANYNEYRNSNPANSSSPIVLYKTYNLETDIALTETTNYATSSTTGYFINSLNYCPASHDLIYKDNDYSITSSVTFGLYDNNANVLEATNEAGISNSIIWGYKNQLPIAKVTNGYRSQISYTGFESGTAIDDDNWNLGYAVLVDSSTVGENTNVYSGRYSSKVNSGGPTKVITPTPQTGKYKFSAFIKTSKSYPSNNAFLVAYTALEGNTIQYPITSDGLVMTAIPNTDGQWKYFETIIDLDRIKSQNGIPASTKLSLICYVTNFDANNAIYIDELRVLPYDAEMMTYTYKQLVGVTSETDINNSTIYTEYDGFNRIKLIRDQDRNILKRFNYVFKQ